MRIVILFMCLAFATAELEQFLKMWQAAMGRLATHDRDNNNVQQTTQSPLTTTTETVSNLARLSLPRIPYYTHPPWASYQDNVAFVYARRKHLLPPSLQNQENDGPHQQHYGDHQQKHEIHEHHPNPGQRWHHPNPGPQQQNHGQHQQDLEIHQQTTSLHQHHPHSAYDTHPPPLSQTASMVRTQYGPPSRSTHRDLELARAEQYVSNIERQFRGTLRYINTLPYTDRYPSSSGNPAAQGPQGPQLHTQPLTAGGLQIKTQPLTFGGFHLNNHQVKARGPQLNIQPWYELNSFQTTYPSPSYNSNPHLAIKRTRYTRELPMFAPGMNPSIQPRQSPYMKEEELPEQYGNRNGWGYSNSYSPPQIVPLYNQGYQSQQYQAQQAQQYQAQQAQQYQAQQAQQYQAQAQQYQARAQQYQSQVQQAQQYNAQLAPRYQSQAQQAQQYQVQAQQYQAQQAQQYQTQTQQYQQMQPMNQQNNGPVEPAYQSINPASNMPYNAQTPEMYPSAAKSTYTQAGGTVQKGMELNAFIPTWKTAFTRSNIPDPQSTGITAYLGQNQQTTMPSNNGFSTNTLLSWPSKTGWDAQNVNQNKDQTQNNYQTQINNQAQNNDQTQIKQQNQWDNPPVSTPQEVVQFNDSDPSQQTSYSLINQRPASPEEIAKMTTKTMPVQTPPRTPTMDQLAYYRPEFLHRIILSG